METYNHACPPKCFSFHKKKGKGTQSLWVQRKETSFKCFSSSQCSGWSFPEEGGFSHLDVLIIWSQGCVSKVHPFGLINWCLLCQPAAAWPLMRIITGGTIQRFCRPDIFYGIFYTNIHVSNEDEFIRNLYKEIKNYPALRCFVKRRLGAKVGRLSYLSVRQSQHPCAASWQWCHTFLHELTYALSQVLSPPLQPSHELWPCSLRSHW